MAYIPEQGDIILLEFNPQAGHEQKGRRPAVVISNNTFNRFTRIAIVCPVTKTDRKFPLHVSLDNRTKTSGVVLCEQVKSLDISARDTVFLEKAPRDILEEIIDILFGFVEIFSD
ncbi:type II toxin-antitoxin system PemK/MazF family toxin [Candidatus Contubernalis alkaliaceticus]|uniref:type II toxin-antitoxin system PemK/MazF family toxin n=1 Tax=Candidatus Contubernalis alkaliaceticus TaxID=338645 RepID=UPI001F4BE946|nr:type II toxin-antitoxin system PemK/MazF family toxin [Candidatus Contubernalis alkalaceticus]UNC92072.1 type II toxin-antitoxin system PemK/MazF family toxin [Candidatus Contubernalis alkalaceticus]